MNPRRVLMLLLASIAALWSAPPSLRAGASTDQPAAIVIFPYVRVETELGVDTIVTLSNDAAAPVTVRCFYLDATARCQNAPGTPCTGADDCGLFGPCNAPPTFGTPAAFTIHLTADQPLDWRVSGGRFSFPCDTAGVCGSGSNAGSGIPAVSGGPFVGALQCVVVDDALRPLDTNALRGTATIEQIVQSPAFIDDATYSGIGLRAISGAVHGDAGLTLGGPHPGYDACPGIVVFEHLFDGAQDDMAAPTSVSTQLALFPCSEDFALGQPTATTVSMLVMNEFEQRFSTSRGLNGPRVSSLSSLDTLNPAQSVFNAAVSGTMAGQTRMQGVSSGIVAVAVESHQPLAFSSLPRTAAYNVHSAGDRLAADLVLMRVPQCPGDCNGDGVIDQTDLATVTTRFNHCLLSCPAGAPVGTFAQGCLSSSNQVLTQCYAADTNGDTCISAGELEQVTADLAAYPTSGCPPLQ